MLPRIEEFFVDYVKEKKSLIDSALLRLSAKKGETRHLTNGQQMDQCLVAYTGLYSLERVIKDAKVIGVSKRYCFIDINGYHFVATKWGKVLTFSKMPFGDDKRLRELDLFSLWFAEAFLLYIGAERVYIQNSGGWQYNFSSVTP